MALDKDGNSKNSSSFKPYDASNSFVKKIANRVTGLIGWRSNSYENVEDFNQEDLPNTSLTDDETISPNPKRIKLRHNAEPHNYPIKSATKEVCNITEPVNDLNVAGPSFKSKCLVASTPAVNYCVKNSPSPTGNVSDYLDSSTPSNISSPLPSCSSTQRHNITVPGVHYRDMSSVTTYDVNKSMNETSTIMSKRRPSFNAEVFSASNKRVKKSFTYLENITLNAFNAPLGDFSQLSLSVCESKNRSCLSPFYSARTMYGGASALLPYSSQSGAKLRVESTSSLNVFSPKNQITIQPVPSPHKGDANDQETMSAAARRILDTLERYCSPIKDAKRIPMNESSSNCEDDTTFTPRGIKRKLPSLTQMTPSTTDLLRIKRQEKMQDSILNARQAISNVPEPSTSVVADLDSSSDSADLDYTVFSDDTRNKDDILRIAKRKETSKYDDRPATVMSSMSSASKTGSNAILNLANLPKYEITETFTFSKPLTLENFDEAASETEVNSDKFKSSSNSATMGNSNNNNATAPNLSGGEQRTLLQPMAKRTGGFISSPTSSSQSRSGSNFSDNEKMLSSKSVTNQKLLQPSSKSNVINNTTSSKYFSTAPNFSSSTGKLGGARWTCRKCLLDTCEDRCKVCASPRPELSETKKDDIQDSSLYDRSNDKYSSSRVETSPSLAASSKDKSNALFGGISSKNINASNTLTTFGTYNDVDGSKSKSGGDHQGFGTTINAKDNCAKDPISIVKVDNSVKNENLVSSSYTADQSQQPNDPWKDWKKVSSAGGQWTCDDCWTPNKKTEAKCASCGAPNKSSAVNAEQDKTAATSKPSFMFGIPASTATGLTSLESTKLGSTPTSIDSTKPATGLMFSFGNKSTATGTTAASSGLNTTAQFSFGINTATTASNAETNTTANYSVGVMKKPDGPAMSFGSSITTAFAGSDTSKVTTDKTPTSSQKIGESGSFSDGNIGDSSTNNKKTVNPFLKFGTDSSSPFGGTLSGSSPATAVATAVDSSAPGATTNSPKSGFLLRGASGTVAASVIRENGEDSQSSSGIFNDITSPGMNSPMKKKPTTGGFPLPTSFLAAKDGVTPFSSNSSASTFGSTNGGLLNTSNTSNEFKLPSSLTNNSGSSGTSTIAPQTNNLFAAPAAGFSSSASSPLSNSKSSETLGLSSSFGNSSSSMSVGAISNNPFGGATGVETSANSSNQPLMFGNSIVMTKKDKVDQTSAADGNKSVASVGGSAFPIISNNTNANVFGGSSNLPSSAPSVATNSIFSHFNNVGSDSTDTALGKGNSGTSAMAATAVTTPSLNFGGNSGTTSANTPFRFGASPSSASSANTSLQQQSSSLTNSGGGFAFNGPPKLDNSIMPSAPKFGQGAFGVPSNVNATTFGSTAAITGSGTTFNFGSTPAVSQPADNSNTTPFSSVIKTSSTQDSLLKPQGNTAFGTAVFGGDATIKKAGGFTFTPSNQMAAPAMNSFSSFTSNVNDNQDQNRMNNSNTSASPFVFGGGSTNAAAPTHNFNLTVPPSFNFTSGGAANSITSFTATAQPANTLSSGGAPVRKIKKAVRRTNK